MLKKKDLAKQFELVVKQEIINHNRAINGYHQSIQQLRQDIQETDKDLSNHASYVDNKFVDERLHYDKKIQSNTELYKVLKTSLNHLRDKVDHFIENTLSRLEIIEKRDLEKVVDRTLKVMNSIHNEKLNELEKKIESLNSKIDLKSSSFSNHLSNHTKELSSTSTFLNYQVKDLEKLLSEIQVDVRCTNERIDCESRDILVSKKHIENLYTLLERHGIKNRGRE